MVGYDRYDTSGQIRQLNTLYDVCSLYINHFLPVIKLVAKERDGSRVKRIFDNPQTPYQRILDSPNVSAKQKAKLRTIHATLDVVKLKEQVDAANAAIKPGKVPPPKLR